MVGASRLVTLTGLGGVGKTRLALAAAARVQGGYSDGVWLTELAALSEPGLLPLSILQALGLQRHETGDDADALIRYLGDKRLLLVIDNCEHLVGACARLVAALLAACPNVRVLATSREPLKIGGEVVYVVPPLGVPEEGTRLSPGDGLRYGAVALFAERAREAVPGFRVTGENEETVARLCRSLDGLPLSIELAAVRLRTLSVEEQLARQGDRYRLLTQGSPAAAPRHQTLRASVEWSFDLCTPAERTLWARASVFAGGFDLATAELVCSGPGLDRDEVLDAFTGLVEKSILSRVESGGRTRHRFLETIREYGRDMLVDSGRIEALRVRHRDHYLELAEQAKVEWFGPEQSIWSARLRAEHANLRAALEFSSGQDSDGGGTSTGLRMALALEPYWMACGQQREGRHWLERLLAAAPPGRERTAGLWLSGFLAALSGDGAEALRHLRECRESDPDGRDRATAAHTVYVTGLALMGRDPAGAVDLLERGVGLERELRGRDVHLPLAMANLGIGLCFVGDIDRAVAMLLEARSVCEIVGERWVRASVVQLLGLAEWLRGEPARARETLREALRQKTSLGDLLGIALTVEFLAWATESAEDPETAATLLGASSVLWEPLGAFLVGMDTFLGWHAECERALTEALGPAEHRAAFAAGRSLEVDEIVGHPPGVAPGDVAPDQHYPSPLTRRENEIALLLGDGRSNREIADRLVIAPRTVDTHVVNIFTKLGFSSRAQVAAWITQRRRAQEGRAADLRSGVRSSPDP